MPEFRLDEQSHTYWLGTQRLFGVTEVIKDNRLMTNEAFYTDFARDRGTAVHLACALLAHDNLDWDSVDMIIRPYVESCALYFEKTKSKARRTEFQCFHAKLLYAGTWDWDGANNDCDSLLLDYKTGAPEPWHKVQTAAYKELAQINRVPIKKRGSLYLQKDGSIAKLQMHDDPNDWRVFLSALNLTNARAA